jgi:hypothetical protein
MAFSTDFLCGKLPRQGVVEEALQDVFFLPFLTDIS